MVIMLVSVLLIILTIILSASSVCVVKPNEIGLLIVLGMFKRKLDLGLRLIPPLVSRVVRMDMRPKSLELPPTELKTRDNRVIEVKAVVTIRIVDPIRAFFEVANYAMATKSLTEKTMATIVAQMTYKDVLYRGYRLESELEDVISDEVEIWGLRVEKTELGGFKVRTRKY